MIVTFLIGNGFDIGLGMNTRFKDMYRGYIVSGSKSKCIERFKQDLNKDAPDYDTWGDFEMGMAKYAKTFFNEKDFIECIRDFKEYMVQYLENEQNRIFEKIQKKNDYMVLCAMEMGRTIADFYKGQSRNVITLINQMKKQSVANRYNFITFNYTMTLDFMLKQYTEYYGMSEKNPIHVHGQIGADVVLGIDNEKQLTDVPFPVNTKVQRAFIKPVFNQLYDVERVETAMRMIEESDVICVYGMSLGESDRTWTNKLIEWLKEDDTHFLIYYDYTDKQYNRCNRDQMMDAEDDSREQFFERILDSKADVALIGERVQIPIAYDIFNFDNVLSAIK